MGNIYSECFLCMNKKNSAPHSHFGTGVQDISSDEQISRHKCSDEFTVEQTVHFFFM